MSKIFNIKVIDPRDEKFLRGLKASDETISHDFFYEELANLISKIRRDVYQQQVSFEEMVSELYLYLSADNWSKLKGFEAKNGSRLRTWMIPLTWRFFVGIRSRLLVGRNELLAGDVTLLPGNSEPTDMAEDLRIQIAIDIKAVLDQMPNSRYAEILRLLLIDGFTPGEVAEMVGTKVDNIYNLKHRAVAQFVGIYGRR